MSNHPSICELTGRTRVVLFVGALVLLTAGSTRAQVGSDRSSSVLFFPDIEVSGTRDTSIVLGNVSNNVRNLFCLFVDRTTGQQVNFDLILARQSAVAWRVSQGLREVGSACGPSETCLRTGFARLESPSRFVPPMDEGFRGHLRCVEVDDSGFVVAGNAFVGSATAIELATGSAEQTTSVGIPGFDTNNLDESLCLGGGVSGACPTGAEYLGCPQTWNISHLVPDAATIVPGVVGDTVFHVVVCSHDFLEEIEEQAILNVQVVNEFEERLVASTAVQGYGTVSLNSFELDIAVLGSEVAATRITSESPVGIVVSAEEIVATEAGTARTALNVIYETDGSGSDIFVLPPWREF